MYEYEYRLTASFSSQEEIDKIMSEFKNAKKYTVLYMNYFRCKDDKWEIKNRLRQVAVYYEGLWFRFVESLELAFSNWNKQQYATFYQKMGFFQNPFIIEHRNEVRSEKAKLYSFTRNNNEFGLVFEYEECLEKKKLKQLPIFPNCLKKYKKNVFPYFHKADSFPYTLKECTRKRVKHVLCRPKDALVAVKHDGVFGCIYSFKDYIYEMWEGNVRAIIPNTSIGDGIVFGAEKMDDGTVILLDVYQVQGVDVYHTHAIFLRYLPSIQNLPLHYKVQTYHKDVIPNVNTQSDGIIYHTGSDIIYKQKPIQTIDLVYENGYFITDSIKIATDENLVNGRVYECDLNFNVIKPRLDRFVGNTANQLSEVIKL